MTHETVSEIYDVLQGIEQFLRFENKSLKLENSPPGIDEYFATRHTHIDDFFATNQSEHFTPSERESRASHFTTAEMPSPWIIGGHHVKHLIKAGRVMDRGGLTKAGRSLAKRGGRLNSAFSMPKGSPKDINRQGEKYIKKIVKHPNRYHISRTSNRFGEVLDIHVDHMGGIRYTKDGKFIHFLEPK